MPLTLADIRVWYPWGSPWLEITDGSDAYPVEARVDTTNAALNAQLRKATLSFERLVSGQRTDDLMLTGIHLLDVSETPWTSARFEAAEAAIDTFWSALVGLMATDTRLAGIDWHRAGPAFDPPNSPGAAVRRVTRSVAGTGSGSNVQLPHQVAISVTERTMLRKRWGRFYLPSPTSVAMSLGSGRLSSSALTTIANAASALYTTLLGVDLVPVVYSRAQPARGTKKGGSLPPKPAAALKVNTLQVDNVPDVIRSRRLKHVTARERRGLAVS
jgi:hypothetical protein